MQLLDVAIYKSESIHESIFQLKTQSSPVLMSRRIETEVLEEFIFPISMFCIFFNGDSGIKSSIIRIQFLTRNQIR